MNDTALEVWTALGRIALTIERSGVMWTGSTSQSAVVKQWLEASTSLMLSREAGLRVKVPVVLATEVKRILFESELKRHPQQIAIVRPKEFTEGAQLVRRRAAEIRKPIGPLQRTPLRIAPKWDRR